MLINAMARLRFISIPPRKMRLVAGYIKGMPVEKALATLNFTPRIAARHLANTVKSAAANALSKEGTDRLHPEDLIVKNIIVDAAPTHKRIRFRSMGRVFRIGKRHCHVTVHIEGHTDTDATAKTSKPVEKKAEKKPVVKKATKKKVAKKTMRNTNAKTAPKKTTTRKTATKRAAK